VAAVNSVAADGFARYRKPKLPGRREAGWYREGNFVPARRDFLFKGARR